MFTTSQTLTTSAVNDCEEACQELIAATAAALNINPSKIKCSTTDGCGEDIERRILINNEQV